MKFAKAGVTPAALLLSFLFAFAFPMLLAVAPARADNIKVIVNSIPITTYDIARRAAFLRLQHRRGVSAEDDMIDQALRIYEIRRLKIHIPDKEVDEAYARFAKNNKLTPKQLDTILARTGVTKAHFKEFIRVQMGWGRVMAAREHSQSASNAADLVRKMMEKGQEKPTATEYMLQQVIFVVPERDKARIGAQRKREAEEMRNRFTGCDKTREFAKGLIDVTVRDLGRVLGPELPPDWAQPIKDTKPGSATIVRQTKRGYEFIGVCSEREVSDDRVAELTLQKQKADNKGVDAESKAFLEQLRKTAVIVKR